MSDSGAPRCAEPTARAAPSLWVFYSLCEFIFAGPVNLNELPHIWVHSYYHRQGWECVCVRACVFAGTSIAALLSPSAVSWAQISPSSRILSPSLCLQPPQSFYPPAFDCVLSSLSFTVYPSCFIPTLFIPCLYLPSCLLLIPPPIQWW